MMTVVDSQTNQMQPTDSASRHVFIFISFGSFINDILYISQKVVNTVALRWLAVGSALNALVGCKEQHDICGLPVEVLHSYCTFVLSFLASHHRLHSAYHSGELSHELPAPKTDWCRCWRGWRCMLVTNFPDSTQFTSGNRFQRQCCFLG